MISRRGFMAGTIAGLGAAGFGFSVNAAGQKILKVMLPSNPSTFDPLNQGNHDAMAVSQLIFENLLEVDGDGALVPQLAADLPEISDDQLTYTFRLKEGVTFHNGAPFTARDVKYSYDYMLNPDNNALRRGYWTTISEVEVVSDYEVRFHLSRPYSPLLASMTKYMGIFPEGSREEAGETFQIAPVGLGTGPALFKAAQSGAWVELERNPAYHGTPPDWDVIRFEIAADPTARTTALVTGAVDVVGAPAARDFLRFTAEDGDIQGAAKAALGATMLMSHNCAAAPFDDVNFRLAVARAFDRAAIGARIYGGLLEPTAVVVPQASPYYSAEADAALSFDVEAAKAHLAASPYAEGAAFELTYPTDAYLLDVRDTALYIQSALAEVGISVTLKPVETGQMMTDVFNGNFQTALWAVVGTTAPTFILSSFFVPGQALQAGIKYSNDEMTALLAAVEAAKAEDIAPLMAQVQALFATEAPAAVVGTPKALNLWSKRVPSFDVNTGITMRLRDVTLAV